jgi:hydrogenase maturation factor HypF (carbamoyltransferase family)
MAHLFTVHPVDPQVRLLRSAAQILDHGGIGAIPTDSCYALACHLDDKSAVDRIRQIRRIDDRHLPTLMCRDLSDIGQYAKVDNRTYRLLKIATPAVHLHSRSDARSAAAAIAPGAQDDRPGAYRITASPLAARRARAAIAGQRHCNCRATNCR